MEKRGDNMPLSKRNSPIRTLVGQASLAATLGLTLFAPLTSFAQEMLEGELDVLHIDYIDGREETAFFLKGEGQRPLKLRGVKAEKPLKSGDRVRVHGKKADDALLVDQVEVLATATEPQAQAIAATNEHKVVLMMVDMQDVKASAQYSLTQIAGEMFYNAHSVDGVYQASSFDQVGFADDTDGDGNADVFGPYSIPYDAAGTCDYYAWAQAAESAASAAGVNLSLYQHRVFVLPRYQNLAQCGWAGIANVGCGSYCRAWVAEGESGMVYAHELGHNLGMGHSSTDPENDGVINSAYGDYSGIMGSNRAWRQMNAPHRVGLGYLNAFANSLADGSQGGIFDLYPLETNAATIAVGTQIVKIPKASGSSESYYLSYRKTLGSYGAASPYADRISVHRYSSSSSPTALIKTLGAGERFEDVASGLTVVALQVGGDIAQVQVSYDCVRTTPGLSLTPATQYAGAGMVRTYNATLTNNDGVSCSSQSFDLSTSAGNGLLTQLSASRLTLQPGESRGFTLDTSASGADGSYAIVLHANGDAGTATDANATLILDSLAPTTPANLTYSVNRKNRVYVSWDAAQDNLSGIASYQVFRDGNLIMSSTTTLIQDQPGEGNHDYYVVAVDKAGNTSLPSAPLTVSMGGGKTGGGTGGGGKGKNR